MSETAPMRSFDQSLPMALLLARESVMRRFRPVLAEHDLSEQQWRVLRALDGADAPLTVGELADRTVLLGPSLSRMLGRLTDRNLIRRATDAGDARRAVITITPTGRRLVATIAPRSEMVYDEITNQIGPDNLDRLYELLHLTASLDQRTAELA